MPSLALRRPPRRESEWRYYIHPSSTKSRRLTFRSSRAPAHVRVAEYREAFHRDQHTPTAETGRTKTRGPRLAGFGCPPRRDLDGGREDLVEVLHDRTDLNGVPLPAPALHPERLDATRLLVSAHEGGKGDRHVLRCRRCQSAPKSDPFRRAILTPVECGEV